MRENTKEGNRFHDSGSNGLGGIISVIVVIVLIWLAFSFFNKKDVWTAHYERTTDGRIYSSQEFSTPEACAAWLDKERQKEASYPTGRYNFECGSNCELSESGIIYVCDKTFDN